MDQLTVGKITDLFMDNEVRESFLRDIINVINKAGLITPNNGQIKIEAVNNTISIYVPIDGYEKRSSF